MQENVDTIIKGWYVVTMNATRDIIRNGAVAIRGREIVAVGKASDIETMLDGFNARKGAAIGKPA